MAGASGPAWTWNDRSSAFSLGGKLGNASTDSYRKSSHLGNLPRHRDLPRSLWSALTLCQKDGDGLTLSVTSMADPLKGSFYVPSTCRVILSREFHLVKSFGGLSVQVVASLPPLKKLELYFSFLFMERTEGGCAVEEACGEEAERWSRAENIRNWRKVRNGAFSWLPHSCNFHATA